jgi:hypothetical protein
MKPSLVVLDEHPDWLSPLYAEFERRGIPYEKRDISADAYIADAKGVKPFYINRLSPSAGKRGHGAALRHAYDYIYHLETFGARVVNGSHTVLLETSKARQATLLNRLGIPHPKTAVANNLKQLATYLDVFTFPVLTKPNCGGSGMGIQKFDSRSELLNAIETGSLSMPEEGQILLQEFIQPDNGHIVRVETINGKIVYAMKVFTQGTFNLCPSDGCDLSRGAPAPTLGYCAATKETNDVRFELYQDVPRDITAAIEKLVRELKLEVAGIEYVVDKDGNWYIYDINALSILRASFKEQYGIDGWGTLAAFFEAEYLKTLEKCR